MAESIAALIVRILTDTSDMVTGTKKASDELDGFENKVDNVSKKLAEHTAASTRAGNSVGSLTGTYRQFDGILQAAGINIGKHVKGLEDVSAAAGKSTGSLGAVGTAGAALGAGIVGWNIGRAVADFFDLDKAIAQTTASLLGYGNLAAEVSGAKQDTINRAIAAGARETVSYAQAIEFLVAAELRKNDAYAVSAERLAAAHKELRGMSEATKAAIAIAQENGATTEQMSRHFSLSADALRVLAERQRDAAKATAEHNREQKQLLDNFEKAYSNALKRKHAEEAADMEDKTRRARSNDEQLDLMERDARLGADRNEFDAAEKRRLDSMDWEERYYAEQEKLTREADQWMQPAPAPAPPTSTGFSSQAGRFASVVNAAPTISIDARGAFLNNPDSLNQLARMVEDAIAKRSSLSNTYTRR